MTSLVSEHVRISQADDFFPTHDYRLLGSLFKHLAWRVFYISRQAECPNLPPTTITTKHTDNVPVGCGERVQVCERWGLR